MLAVVQRLQVLIDAAVEQRDDMIQRGMNRLTLEG